jgi:hypothetical protein
MAALQQVSYAVHGRLPEGDCKPPQAPDFTPYRARKPRSASSRVSNTWTTSPVAPMARKRNVRIKAVRKSVIDPAIATHRGRMVKTTGDGMLVEFASAFDEMRCTVRPIARAACDAFLKA